MLLRALVEQVREVVARIIEVLVRALLRPGDMPGEGVDVRLDVLGRDDHVPAPRLLVAENAQPVRDDVEFDDARLGGLVVILALAVSLVGSVDVELLLTLELFGSLIRLARR